MGTNRTADAAGDLRRAPRRTQGMVDGIDETAKATQTVASPTST